MGILSPWPSYALPFRLALIVCLLSNSPPSRGEELGRRRRRRRRSEHVLAATQEEPHEADAEESGGDRADNDRGGRTRREEVAVHLVDELLGACGGGLRVRGEHDCLLRRYRP